MSELWYSLNPQDYESRRFLWERITMADPENYIPKINDPVVIGGSHDRFVVVGINTSKKTAEVRPVNSAIVLHNDVPWSKLFYLDGRERCADRENSH